MFVLKEKRWSVNYGLHPARCLMVVTYRAKGVPAASAEFAHPDIQILLTCLSYYYTGITYDQFCRCFKILAKSDEPASEYETWIAGCEDALLEVLRSYNAINMENEAQCRDQLWPALRYSKKLADYFLSNVVFPRGQGV